MATSLSDEEFNRMQTQLLELRTKNYTLGEKNVKIQTDLLQANQVLEETKKELARCQKIIARSKNAKDIEQLVQENESLQQKLQMQEDEFRLQNETLMKEISSLVSENERFQKELELVKAQTLVSSDLQNQGDRIKLEAENAALKKIISNYETNGTNSEGNETDKSNRLDLDLQLNTVLEEKRLLQENVKKVESEFREKLMKLQNENDKLTEKLKKKQESFLILQEEKEKLYNENKTVIQNMQLSKNSEIQQLKEQAQNMQLELKKALQFNEQSSENNLEKDMDATVELDGDKATFDYSLNETRASLINIQEKIQSLNSQLSESENKVKTLEGLNEELNAKVRDLEKALSESEESLKEKTKLAEKRKKMMDDMKEHLIETTNKQTIEIENLTRKLAEEQEAFKNLFDKEKETEVKLIEARREVDALKDEIEKLRSARCNADDKIKDLEEKMQNKAAEYEELLKEKDEKHTQELEVAKQKFDAEIQDLTIQLEVVKAEKTEFEEKVKALEQDIKDSVDDRKIQEKKGYAMVKDLKRQLQVERNRAEKLQERLQEVLNEQNRSVDEILQSSAGFEKPKGDASSISSWSYVSGGTAERENKDVTQQSDTSSGGHDSPNRISPTLLESETNNLLAKVAQLQQKNWVLEEKVNHLEMSNEALVDDVLKKTALIQFYCMEGRSDPHSSAAPDKLSIKRIVDFIKDRGDENLKEINRRMQRMLEETLTKNMHLQKDIETLSNEVSRLSKLAVSSPNENGVKSTVLLDNV
ncbi:GRIP1-associated protein 1 like protein [Argiope bruennichi]|uniref:GRIP1-associated protein 1 like protein n=1 Tax=Argiope bruennichi TaxID=94029 RepID=A0A8T0ETT2_ARGBR|nr:GRIP1-associated protein 1 like protein [Argiope bruennichi]